MAEARKTFEERFWAHQMHVLDNRFAMRRVRGGRYTMSAPAPRIVPGCLFCEQAGLLDKLLQGVEES